MSISGGRGLASVGMDTAKDAVAAEWLNDIPETAERLHCSERLVRELVATGELVATRVRRRVLIAESDLRAFIARNRGS